MKILQACRSLRQLRIGETWALRKLSSSSLSSKNLQANYSSSKEGSGHASHSHHDWSWHEPSGWLFGYKPGYRRSWYWWEPIWYTFMVGGLLMFVVMWHYRAQKTPIEMAKEEAHRRLASRGEEFGYPLPPGYSSYRKKSSADQLDNKGA